MQNTLVIPNNQFLTHYGAKGMHWGIRRYQNNDGSLTSEGRAHYGVGAARISKSISDSFGKASNFISSYKGKSFNDIKIDALDYANRKGMLDFLDSKADAPFKAIEEVNVGYTPRAARDPFEFLKKMDVLDTSIPSNYQGDSDRFQSMIEKGKTNERFSKGLDYASDFFDPQQWGDTSVKLFGQSVSDKKLGMISKDLRDIERAVAGKEFVDTLRSSGDLATTLSSDFFNTDFRGYHPYFSGKAYEESTARVGRDFIWQPVYSSDGKKIGENRVATRYEDIRVADISRPTQEFLDYRASLVMPSDYSHVGQGYESTHRSNARDILARTAFKHDAFLAHHGIRGQKWGQRRYQNNDGSLTTEGRAHYGVGPARLGSALKSGASKAGNAIRKAVKPTDAELLERYDKAQAKQARRELKEQIREMEGHKKKIKDMSDDEVRDWINRYKNERELKSLMKDAGKSRTRLLIEDKARQGLAQALGATTQGVVGNIGKGISDAFDTKEGKAQRKARIVDAEKKIKDAEEGESAADRLKKYADMSKQSRDAYESQLQEAALRGDETAKQRLSDYKKSVTGRHERAEEPNVDVNEDTSTSYEAPSSTRSNRQNGQPSVQDVVDLTGSGTYEAAVEDADTSSGAGFVRRRGGLGLPSGR